MRWTWAVGAAVAMAALAGCAGAQPSAAVSVSQTPAPAYGPVAASSAPAPAGAERGYNLADVVFLQQMIGHHELALQMAQLAPTHTSTPKVLQLASSVQTESNAEVQTMGGWLSSLGIDAGQATFGGHDHGGGGPTQDDVTALGAKSGAAFDSGFVDLMTSHSIGADQLAQAEVHEGSNTAELQLAAAIARRESDRAVTLPTLLD